MVDVLRSSGITIPFPDVKAQKGFFGMSLRSSIDIVKVTRQVDSQKVIEFFAKKVCCQTLVPTGSVKV
jgi:hypothetical protein